MKRREFIKCWIGGIMGFGIILPLLVKTADLRRIVIACKTDYYPGTLIQIGDVTEQGKWRG